MDFMAEAFDAKELARVVGDDGKIGHAETRIGDSVVMTFDAKDGWPDTPAFLRLYVEDCEATYGQALSAGGHFRHETDRHAVGRSGRARSGSPRQPVVADDATRES